MRGCRSGISFTVETDGRLPDGTGLGDAVELLDAATGAGPPTSSSTAPTPTTSPRAWTPPPRGPGGSPGCG